MGKGIRAGGRVVGSVQGDRFIKKVQGQRHMLRSPRAWALDLRSLKDAEAAGARTVQLYDKDSGLTYAATVALIRAKGFCLNRGYGAQIALPLDQWQVERPGARQLAFVVVDGG